MKFKITGIILVWLASAGIACASTNDITTLVQKGLFEEEANHHLDAAIECYQEAIGHFDKDRQLTATAIFRLGECYRLQGKTNEANVQYQRIVHEFGDQTQLVDLSRGYLPKTGARSTFTQNLTKISDGTTGGATFGVGRRTLPEESSEEQEEIRRIKNMIQNSPDLIKGGEHDPNTPLVEAAGHGWMEVTKLLLDNGAIVNPESPRGWTPLGRAADAANKGMVELLLSNGANINALDGRSLPDRAGWAPLHYAVANGFKTVAETLLAHGADVDVQARDGSRPLYIASARGYIAMAELLLAHKADVNAPTKGGETALFTAVQNNHLEMVQFLISNKADINIKSYSGRTPLLAGMGGDTGIAIVKTLLEHGADATASMDGMHPLDNAIDRSIPELVELLLDNHADSNAAGKWSGDLTATPLIRAIWRRSPAGTKIAALLLQHSANPDRVGGGADIKIPLIEAIRFGNTNIIADLILHHADVNALDREGEPPLAYDSRNVHDDRLREQIRQMLIKAGASEDYQRQGGIFIAQKGTGSIGNKVFSKGANAVNRYTLFDLMATAYTFAGYGHIDFPDLAHVAINRIRSDGSKEEIAVDLNAILQSGDCSKNPWLEWGDVVQIPELDHRVNESWNGLLDSEKDVMGKCLLRKVKIIVKGQTTEFTLVPPIGSGFVIHNDEKENRPQPQPAGAGPGYAVPGLVRLGFPPSRGNTFNGESVLYTLDLNDAVHKANLLLISSDLGRVKVSRRELDAATGQPLMKEFNLETQPAPVVQLVDGDVIEIPEREQK